MKTAWWIVFMAAGAIALFAGLDWVGAIETVNPHDADAAPHEYPLLSLYEDVCQSMLCYELTSSQIEAFEVLLQHGGGSELREQAYACLRIDTGTYPTAATREYRELYSMFSRCFPTSDVMYEFLCKRIADDLDVHMPTHKDPGAVAAWSWADSADTAVNLWKITGERRFLDLVIESYNQVLMFQDRYTETMDDFRGRIMNGWGLYAGGETPSWEVEITLQGRITAPILRLIYIVQETNAPWEGFQTWARTAQLEIRAIIDQYLSEFVFDDSDEPSGYFMNLRTGDQEPVNHQAAYARTCLYLYLLTGEDKYRDIVTAVVNYLVSGWQIGDNGAAYWPYKFHPEDPSAEYNTPFWKASVTQQFLCEVYHYQMGFSRDQMELLVRTFTQNVYQGFGSFNVYTDGTFRPFSGYNAVHTGQARPRLAMWITLAAHDSDVSAIIAEAVGTRIDIFPNGWLNGAHPCMATALSIWWLLESGGDLF